MSRHEALPMRLRHLPVYARRAWRATSTAAADKPVNAGVAERGGPRGPWGGPSSDTEDALDWG